MTTTGSLGPASAYGARPVSVDIARGRSLVEAKVAQQTESPVTGTTLPFSHQVVADRLSLAHWPPGHQNLVCSLAGGTGCTTLAGLLATVLAELPFAYIWQPMAMVEAAAARPRITAAASQAVSAAKPSGWSGSRGGVSSIIHPVSEK